MLNRAQTILGAILRSHGLCELGREYGLGFRMSSDLLFGFQGLLVWESGCFGLMGERLGQKRKAHVRR